MKRIFGLIILASLLTLTACGGDNANNESANNSTSDKDLVFWSYIAPTNPEGELLQDMIEEYNDATEGVTIKHEYIPHGDYHQQLSTAVAGDSLPDVLVLDNPDHARYASMDVLADITDKIEDWGEADQFLEGPWESTLYDGKNYGLPFYSNALAMFYNKDIFEEKGIETPPTTWDELEEVASELSYDSTFGFAMAGTSGPEGLFHYLPFLLSTGADYDQLDSPEAVRSLDLLTNLLEEESMNDEMLNWNQGDVLNQFSSGNAAMMVNGPWQIASLQEKSPDLNFGIALLPKDERYASVLGGENLAVSQGDNEEEAWEFIKWLTEADQMERYTVGSGQFPSRVDVADSNDHWEQDEHLSVFLEAVQNAYPRGPHPEWNQIAEAIQGNVQKALTESLTPQEAIDAAATEVNAVIEE